MKTDKSTLQLVPATEIGAELNLYANLKWHEALERFAEIVGQIISDFDYVSDDYIFSIIANPSLTENGITKKYNEFRTIIGTARDRVRAEKFTLFEAYCEQLGTSPFNRIALTTEAKEFRSVEVVFDEIIDLKSSIMYHAALTLLSKQKIIIDITDIPKRLGLLESFAKRTAGEGVAEYAKLLFPELNTAQLEQKITGNASTLPLVPPEEWQHSRQRGETPPDFIQRVYGEWLGNGLDRATVRRLDPKLGQALDNWLRKNDMPNNIDLPTPKQRAEREIERLRDLSETGDPLEAVGEFTLREAQRIRTNISRHNKNSK